VCFFVFCCTVFFCFPTFLLAFLFPPWCLDFPQSLQAKPILFIVLVGPSSFSPNPLSWRAWFSLFTLFRFKFNNMILFFPHATRSPPIFKTESYLSLLHLAFFPCSHDAGFHPPPARENPPVPVLLKLFPSSVPHGERFQVDITPPDPLVPFFTGFSYLGPPLFT